MKTMTASMMMKATGKMIGAREARPRRGPQLRWKRTSRIPRTTTIDQRNMPQEREALR